MNYKKPLVSIIFVTFNYHENLIECLQSLKGQTYSNYEVIIVDNGSGPSMLSYLQTLDDSVKCITTGVNNGFGKGNNIGIAASNGELIVFSNYDTVYDPHWLESMVDTACSADDIGVVAPKILFYDDRQKINTCGLFFSYLGYACSSGLYQPTEAVTEKKEIGTASGCCFLIKKTTLDKVGVFDEEYHHFGSDFFFSSLEDIDLCWRVRLAGEKILLNPDSVLYHKYYKKELLPLRYLYLECGRYYILLKNYRLFTLLVMFPALAVFEILAWLFAALNGLAFLKTKCRSYGILFNKLKIIQSKRLEIKKIRKVNDQKIVAGLGSFIELQHVALTPVQRKIIGITLYPVFSLCKILTMIIINVKCKVIR
jgi:GT2 family glycosyltransferase